MEYISTRNNKIKVSFEHVFIKGLSSDGGLFLPANLEQFSEHDLKKLSNLNYKNLAIEIINKFTSSFISKSELIPLINKSYSNFREENIVKLKKINNNFLLELFHGPTLAFKDIAMQFIGNLYEHYLEKNNKKINVIVATSGDTGAAAIDAIKGKKNMNIFVLHPKDRISPIQRKLMTTSSQENVFNYAIEGNFDDCQKLVKSMFSDTNFANNINMSGVNSINWARIIAQTVYYFYCYFLLKKKKISFSVPTGNFGDVYAGYVSKKMGLPIEKLLVATNENDILHRTISKGDYKSKKVEETISPSMDIQVASNFERLLYDLNDYNSDIVKENMQCIKNNNFNLDNNLLLKLRKDFISESLNQKEIIDVIKYTYEKNNMIIDPHTAIGLGAVKKLDLENFVVLATAHPCKFPDAVFKAISMKESLPDNLKHILAKEEKYEILKNNIDDIKKRIKEHLNES